MRMGSTLEIPAAGRFQVPIAYSRVGGRFIEIADRLFAGDCVSLFGPGTQIDQFATFAAKRPERIVAPEFDHGATLRTPDSPRYHPYKLQYVRLKSTSDSKSLVRCTLPGRMKRIFNAYLLALISGTQGKSRISVTRNICAARSMGIC